MNRILRQDQCTPSNLAKKQKPCDYKLSAFQSIGTSNQNNQNANKKPRNSNNLPPSPVLLVCIFNKTGKIITHDYFYENFAPYGQIVKILIFQKAKVWKTFVQFRSVQQAELAKQKLNNKVVFDDGSKMNIFPAKLRSIQLQNSNLGGVNYQQLNQQISGQEKAQYWIQQNQWQAGYPNQHQNFHYQPESRYLDSNSVNINNNKYGINNQEFHQSSSLFHGYYADDSYKYQQKAWQNEGQFVETRGRRSTLGGTPNQRTYYKSSNSINQYVLHSPLVLHQTRVQDKEDSKSLENNLASEKEYRINFEPYEPIRQDFFASGNRSIASFSKKSDVGSKQSSNQNQIKKRLNQSPTAYLLTAKSNVKSSRSSQNGKRLEQKPIRSLFCDIDEQFRQIAEQSQQYQQWKKTTQNQMKSSAVQIKSPQKYQNQSQFKNRRKSLTVNFLPHSHTQQFIQENIPSRVLFIRSIPNFYSPEAIYNIFSNFGEIIRVIYMRNKMSSLVQYSEIENAIQAKDQLNYCKCEIRVFYSHYESLMNRYVENQHDECQQFICLNRQNSTSQSSYIGKSQKKKVMPLNPPSDTLYLTQILPHNQNELYQVVQSHNCKIVKIEWKKQNSVQLVDKDRNGSFSCTGSNYKGKRSSKTSSKPSKQQKEKWMCLIQLRNINQSLIIMGKMQDYLFLKGKRVSIKPLRVSFTRSKISGIGDTKRVDDDQTQKLNFEEGSNSPERKQRIQCQIKQVGSAQKKKESSPQGQQKQQGRVRNRWNTVSFRTVPECQEDEGADVKQQLGYRAL